MATPNYEDFCDLDTLARQVHDWAQTKGWNDREVPIPEFIALCHSELSEALEDYRHHHLAAEIYYKTGQVEGVAEPCGIPIELADVIIRILHFCGARGISIRHAFNEKMYYNEKRPHKHGGKKI